MMMAGATKPAKSTNPAAVDTFPKIDCAKAASALALANTTMMQNNVATSSGLVPSPLAKNASRADDALRVVIKLAAN
jgi:hypothetical protein